jgi:hypothetical protein
MNNEHIKKLEKKIFYHPRLKIQHIPKVSVNKILENFPDLISFPQKKYNSFMLIFDWDHLLPSEKIFARLHAFYTLKSEKQAKLDFKKRWNRIKEKDLFPEFDIFDFEDIFSDEYYNLTLDISGEFESISFISPWKYSFKEKEQKKTISIIKKNVKYNNMLEFYPESEFGPLRVISWLPPCISGLNSWTVDVRYVTHSEDSSIWGKYFLVDLLTEKVLKIGSFNVRT